MSELKDKCGIVGIYNQEKAADLAYLGLFALQHRGEEGAGIATFNGDQMHCHKALGLVGEVFNPTILDKLSGQNAIGHVRYSTTGSSVLKNVQPIVADYSRGQIAVAHNGNLTNAIKLRDELEAYGAIFSSTMDSEIIVHLIANPKARNWEESLIRAVEQLEGAYCFTILTEKSLIGVRDPNGFRPLSLGKLGDGWVLASETCALDLLGAEFVRDIEPGEVIIIDESGLRSLFPFKAKPIKIAQCIFEHVYFARPDSIVFGESVARVRIRLGEALAKEHPVEADLVTPVPDSGNFAALGFSKASGIPFEFGYTRNHYIGRTFILPEQGSREFKVRIKLNPIREIVEGKRVVIVDDSIVRGNTSRSRVNELRKAGAKEVHLRISCPPHKYGCFYGIDFPSRGELIANKLSMAEIEKYLGVDSLGYLSEEGMLSAVEAHPNDHFCRACFSGEYPTDISKDVGKYTFERN